MNKLEFIDQVLENAIVGNKPLIRKILYEEQLDYSKCSTNELQVLLNDLKTFLDLALIEMKKDVTLH